jgi:hypothetical protein
MTAFIEQRRCRGGAVTLTRACLLCGAQSGETCRDPDPVERARTDSEEYLTTARKGETE